VNDSSQIRLLIVDDHFFVRTGLRTSLAEEADFEIVGDVASAGAALDAVAKLRPDVLILDGRLPDLSGIEVASRLLPQHPDLRIVMHSIAQTEEEIGAAVRAGVHAYVPKSAERSELVAAIRAVRAGQRYFSTPIVTRLIQSQNRLQVSGRELEVLRLIAQGLSNKEIADRLQLSESTVKMHVGSILNKLGASDRAHAVALGAQRGLLSLAP
jgi:two-component system NarL family response regulator